MSFNVESVRADFPALRQKINGERLVYLDSAASALKPLPVIDALHHFYSFETANVHRGIHTLSANATDRFEEGRRKVQNFLSAIDDSEIVFTKGTTESINLVAQGWAAQNLREGDEILLSEMEHHSNLVPWQMLAQQKNLKLQFVAVTDHGEFDLESFEKLLSDKTKLVALSHCSNTLGTVNPVETIIKKAHALGSKVMLDAAQSATLMKLNVQELDCDFLAFSGHKLFGPYGIGVLYAKRDLLESMSPYQGGGSMISEVSLEKSTYNDPPFRFEAGTPHISGVIGLAEAIDYVESLGMAEIEKYENELTSKVLSRLREVEGLRLIGDAEERAPIFSFTVDGIHANDVGEILDQKGIAVRTGHHCTQPLMKRFGVSSTVRASFSIYNTEEDLEALIAGIQKSKEMLA